MALPGSFGNQLVAAAATDTVLGTAGAVGDHLAWVVIQPTTTAASCIVKDNATAKYTLTAGTLADLSPKTVPFNTSSASGAWKVTTVNCTVLAIGSFS